MRKGDQAYFKHPFVLQMFEKNEQFYKTIFEQNYPICRLVNRPNNGAADIVKVLAPGILGDKLEVVRLLNIHHPGWRKAF